MDNDRTIFIPIGRAGHVRNLLFNDFFKLLSNKYRVVFLVSDTDPEFCKKFAGYDIEILLHRSLTPFKKRLERIFISIHRALIFNPSSEVFAGLGRGTSVNGVLLASGEAVKYKRLRYFLARYIFGILLARKSIRVFFKFLDRIIFPCRLYDALIDKYKPALVFITSIGSDDQIALLRNCQARHIPSLGMAGSWDNLSKWGFREKADIFVVWSQYMEEEALKFQGYAEDKLRIVGVPQFDYYKNPNLLIGKDEFVKKFKVDPTKKIILFGSEGPICEDDPYVVSFLQEKIKDGTLANYQVLVRPHFSYKTDINRYLQFVDNETVFIDTYHEVSEFKDRTALSLNTVKNLMAEIRYSDVAITSASTLVLDIVANGKFPILYSFDKDKDKPLKESTKRFYGSLWFREIIKMGLDNMVNSENELIEKIKEVSQNPDKDFDKREKLLERFCYRIDGNSGKRLFEVIDDYLNSQTNLSL